MLTQGDWHDFTLSVLKCKEIRKIYRDHPYGLKPYNENVSTEKQYIVSNKKKVFDVYPIENCDQCHDLLMIEKLPDPSSVSQYELLRFKTYREMSCLVYPSNVFSDFVHRIENLFFAMFGGVMYEKDLIKMLCSNADNEISQIHKCGSVHCFAKLQEYVKLYMSVRIHHAIKISNMGMSSGYKRNRKMPKLCHE